MHGAKRRAALDSLARGAVGKWQTTATQSGAKVMKWEIKKIIEVANCLASTGSSGASTGERIAAAFVLNRMEFLPASYQDVVEAWDRLDDEWQEYVRIIKQDYQHELVPW
jgi:hypothetical protein